MWHQDYVNDTYWKEHDKPHLTLNRQLGVIYSKKRKFIVVARFKDDYLALWVTFYFVCGAANIADLYGRPTLKN